MRTRDTVRLALCGLALMTLPAYTSQVQTAPTIIWETSFTNCPDWNQTMGIRDEHVCATGDGIAGWGNWTTSKGGLISITAAANNSIGGSGKGLRAMKGDGRNNVSGGLRITLPGVYKELWVRYYMRYQAGFNWTNGHPHYTKELYFNDTVLTEPVFVHGFASGSFGVNVVRPGSYNMNSGGGVGSWQSINGSSRGDGKFHSYEVHVKMDTNGSNGIAETWVDGVLAHRSTNVDWGGSTGWHGWSFFTVAINQNEVANGGVDMYTDYDDFAVSTTGYIGPIGNTTQQGPSAPANLRITP
jgi:hypothetical protein